MKKISSIYSLIIIFLGLNSMKATTADSLFFAKLLPDSLYGWQKESQDEIYTPQNLYEFIDGGAELYLSYGFQKLFHRAYSRPNHPDILVDIFDMGNAANAFGVFMHTRENIDSTFGQGSEYVQGFLNFWKGKYYISLLALAETDATKKALFELAHYIDNHILEKGELPTLVEKLPRKGLKQASIRYFHHYVWINSYIFLSNKNILRISNQEQIVLARYTNGTTLMMVQYANSSKASQVWNELKEKYFNEIKTGHPFQRQNSWLLFKFHDPYLIVLANDQTSNSFDNILQALLKKIED